MVILFLSLYWIFGALVTFSLISFSHIYFQRHAIHPFFAKHQYFSKLSEKPCVPEPIPSCKFSNVIYKSYLDRELDAACSKKKPTCVIVCSVNILVKPSPCIGFVLQQKPEVAFVHLLCVRLFLCIR